MAAAKGDQAGYGGKRDFVRGDGADVGAGWGVYGVNAVLGDAAQLHGGAESLCFAFAGDD